MLFLPQAVHPFGVHAMHLDMNAKKSVRAEARSAFAHSIGLGSNLKALAALIFFIQKDRVMV